MLRDWLLASIIIIIILAIKVQINLYLYGLVQKYFSIHVHYLYKAPLLFILCGTLANASLLQRLTEQSRGVTSRDSVEY